MNPFYFLTRNILLLFFLFLINESFASIKEVNKKAVNPTVEAIQVKKSILFTPILFGGRIRPLVRKNVFSETEGLLETLLVNLGQKVKKGQKIGSVKPLSKGQNFRSQTLYSPIDGFISSLNFKEGDLIRSYTPLLSVIQKINFEIKVMANIEELNEMKIGREVDIIIAPGMPQQKTVKGSIFSLSPTSSGNRSIYPSIIRFSCKNNICPKSPFLGSFAKIRLKTNLRRGIRINSRYLMSRKTQAIILKNKKAFWQNIKTGQYFGEEIEILSGIKEGDLLITNYSKVPSHNEEVQIKSQKDSNKSSVKSTLKVKGSL